MIHVINFNHIKGCVTGAAATLLYDRPYATEVILKDMAKSTGTNLQRNTTKHEPYAQFLGVF